MAEVINMNGFANLGNTCFMNSSLQLLLHCDDLSDFMIDIDTNQPISDTYQDLVIAYTTNKNKTIAPRDLKNKLAKKYRAYRTYDQQDAHEFIVRLLDAMEEELKHDKRYNNNISDLFDCKITKNIKSLQSKERSKKTEHLRMLCLPIPDLTDVDLDDCVRQMFKDEILNDPLWEAPSGKRVKAIKRTVIERYPKYLIFELKRYNNMGRKIKRPVDISRTWSATTGEIFRLKAFILQSGDTGGGHYTACVYIKDTWYYCSDSHISKVSLQNAMNSARHAYLILYVKNSEIIT